MVNFWKLIKQWLEKSYIDKCDLLRFSKGTWRFLFDVTFFISDISRVVYSLFFFFLFHSLISFLFLFTYSSSQQRSNSKTQISLSHFNMFIKKFNIGQWFSDMWYEENATHVQQFRIEVKVKHIFSLTSRNFFGQFVGP
jgi:hypothetical protein